MRITSLVILIVLVLSDAFGQHNQPFASGNEAFKESNYVTAVAEYSKLLDQGYYSSELYHNLGTSYLQLNQIGKAVLYLEKALIAKPSDRRVRQNLAIARDKVDTAVIEVPDFFVLRFWKSFSRLLSPLLWLVVSLLMGVMTVYGIYRWRLGMSGSDKLTGFTIMIIGSILLLLCHFAGRSSLTQMTDDSVAIVMKGTTLYNAADNRSEEVEILSEGVKVRINDELDDWYQVSLVNKEVGWVTKGSVEKVANAGE